MARQELHSSKLPNIEQRAPLPVNATTTAGDFIAAEHIGSVEGDYLANLAMMEEPVTVRLEPSSERNAPSSFPIWVNGRGVEVFLGGKWVTITYLPHGLEWIIKRKYLGVMAAAKTDAVATKILEGDSDRPNNVTTRITSAVVSFSVLEDRNPNGAAWLAEVRRRNT